MLVVDPLVLDKQFDRFRRGKRTLGAVCERYGVTVGEGHAANADALAAARIAFKLGATVADLHEIDLRVLHREQVSWAVEQAASLEEYFRQQGRREHVGGAWPIVPSGLPTSA
jgi:DNA polymerase-3 subunit epsilon